MQEIEENGAASHDASGPYEKNVVIRRIAPLLLGLCALAVFFMERVSSWVHQWGGESNVEKLIWGIIIVTLSATIMNIGKSLSRLESEFSTKARDFSEKLPTIIAEQKEQVRLIKKVQEQGRGFEELQEQGRKIEETQKVLARRVEQGLVETNILRSLRRIYRRAESEKLKRIHLLAAVKVLENMHKHNLNRNFKNIELLDNGQNIEAPLSDFSVAFSLLKEIEEGLPNGSVWFGVTHLTNPVIWSEKSLSTEFHEYRTHMWKRASAGKLSVFRIYCFPRNSPHIEKFEKILRQESVSKVQVRIIEGDPSEFPDDMSLLWAPNAEAAGGPPPVSAEAMNASQSIRDLMVDSDREPVCGLKFDVKNLEHLNSVIIHDPQSPGFRTLCNQFKDAWDNKSHVYDPDRAQHEADART